LGNPDATSFSAKNTSFAPGSASGSPAVPLGTLAPATPAFASGSYSSAAPGSVLARLQAKWRQEAEDKRQKKNEEAKEKKEKSKAELKRKIKEIEQAYKFAKKEKKDAARKKA
jgi:DNA repair exonuclease SbcCD ATPase subunit